MGINPDHISHRYYTSVLTRDYERITTRFATATSNGIIVERRSIETNELLKHLAKNGPIIALTNANLLQCEICESSSRNILRWILTVDWISISMGWFKWTNSLSPIAAVVLRKSWNKITAAIILSCAATMIAYDQFYTWIQRSQTVSRRSQCFFFRSHSQRTVFILLVIEQVFAQCHIRKCARPALPMEQMKISFLFSAINMTTKFTARKSWKKSIYKLNVSFKR